MPKRGGQFIDGRAPSEVLLAHQAAHANEFFGELLHLRRRSHVLLLPPQHRGFMTGLLELLHLELKHLRHLIELRHRVLENRVMLGLLLGFGALLRLDDQLLLLLLQCALLLQLQLELLLLGVGPLLLELLVSLIQRARQCDDLLRRTRGLLHRLRFHLPQQLLRREVRGRVRSLQCLDVGTSRAKLILQARGLLAHRKLRLLLLHPVVGHLVDLGLLRGNLVP